jgi:hypothetical protein
MPNIKIELKETKAAADLNTPVFAHAKIGKNRNPFLKCDDFKEIIETGLGEKTDIAFLKLCFVDISWETDIKALFDYYSKTIRELESKYPRVRFFSVTVPLLASETGILAKIKKLTGQRSLSEEDNIRRDQFNATMREAYGKSGRLFDLAAYEAIRPNGSTSTFSNNKKEYPCLASEWTSDGGHLNEAGEKYIAKELLLFLVKLQ